MEGSYSKVWNAREEAPAEEYKFFVDSLMGTIRYAVSRTPTAGSAYSPCHAEMRSPAAKRRRTIACQ